MDLSGVGDATTTVAKRERGRERERGKKGKIEGRDNGQVGERARMKTKEPEWARRKGN